jgi:hypothetical protein
MHTSGPEDGTQKSPKTLWFQGFDLERAIGIEPTTFSLGS